METRANYALIGAFTLAVVVAAFLFVYWFTDMGSSKKRQTVDIVFSGSVSGLSVGSSVLFNGIPVGQVVNIRIRPEDPRQVEARAQVNDGTPVRSDTVARLEYQGLTGAASISLRGGDPRSPELTTRDNDDFPEIFAEQSDFQELLETARSIAARANDLVGRMDNILNRNEESINNIVKNVETFTGALGGNSEGINKFMSQIGDTGQVALEGVQSAATSIKTLADNLDSKLKEISAGLTRFTGTGLQQYQNLAVEAQKSLNELNRVLRGIERNPQQFITGPKANIPQYNGR